MESQFLLAAPFSLGFLVVPPCSPSGGSSVTIPSALPLHVGGSQDSAQPPFLISATLWGFDHSNTSRPLISCSSPDLRAETCTSSCYQTSPRGVLYASRTRPLQNLAFTFHPNPFFLLMAAIPSYHAVCPWVTFPLWASIFPSANKVVRLDHFQSPPFFLQLCRPDKYLTLNSVP